MKFIYIVEAWRLGCRDLHHYTVGVSTIEETAKDMVRKENNIRGGKYSTLVRKTVDSQWEITLTNAETVAYYSSFHGETELYSDHFYAVVRNMYIELRQKNNDVKNSNPLDRVSPLILYKRMMKGIRELEEIEKKDKDDGSSK